MLLQRGQRFCLSSLCLSLCISIFTPRHNVLASVSAQQQSAASSDRPKILGSAEKRLAQRLLHRYAQWGVVGRPVMNSSDVLTVRLGLALIQILDLEENQQRLRTNCWMRFSWKDSLLAWEDWSDEEFRDIKQIRVRPSEIWTPDIKLYNFADERMLEKREARVVVQSSGEILWIPQALLKSTCKVKILNFPFDTQECRIKFGSWTYDESQLMLDWSLTEIQVNATHSVPKPLPFVDYNDYVKSNEWETDGEYELDVVDPDQRLRQIRSVVSYRNETGFDHRGRPVMKRYRILEFCIRMMRNPSFYVAILVVPCILLSMLTLVIFWLPPESPAKILLGMNIFVAFFILLLLLAEQIPSAVETFPLIGCYYCMNMGLITFSTFVAAVIVNLHFHGDKSGPVPPLLRRIMIEGLGQLFLIQLSVPLPLERRALVRQLSSGSQPEQRRRPSGGKGGQSLYYQHPHQHQHQNQKMQFRIVENRHSPQSGAAPRRAVAAFYDGSKLQQQPQQQLLLTCPPDVEGDLREISRAIRLLLGRKKDADDKSLLAVEWRTLAQVLDRLFFLLYVILLITFLQLFIPRRVEYVKRN